MKIEFKKVPNTTKELVCSFNSVKIEGTFCKISNSLVKIEAKLTGKTDVDCCRCGTTEEIDVDENLNILLSDGVFRGSEDEEIVIEIENGTIDFDEIIESELNSIKSEYHICQECEKYGDDFEKEF